MPFSELSENSVLSFASLPQSLRLDVPQSAAIQTGFSICERTLFAIGV